jgi:hypothetical protein
MGDCQANYVVVTQMLSPISYSLISHLILPVITIGLIKRFHNYQGCKAWFPYVRNGLVVMVVMVVKIESQSFSMASL